MTIRAVVRGVGHYLPDRIVPNTWFEDKVDTSDEWIRARSGIERRHFAAEGQTTSDMAAEAATNALAMAGLAPDDIDAVIVATSTADLTFPSAATMVQDRLGMTSGFAFDVQAVCAGFVFALANANALIVSGQARRVLVIGAETFSRILDWSDRSTCVLFGDGAGAVILQASDEPGILATHLGADGQYKELLYYPVGASKDLYKAGTDDASIIMVGNEVFKVAVKTLGNVAVEVLEKAGISQDELDWLVPHQANIRIIQATAKRLDLPMEKVILTVQDHGNTSAASVPMALDVGIRDGRIKKGQLVLMEAFGGGFTWGSVLMRL